MKQKLIIAAAVLLLIVVLVLMTKDMFVDSNTDKINPYAYKLDNFKDIDSSQFCYTEVKRFNPLIEKLNGIAIDADDNIYLTGLQKVIIYNNNLEFQKEFNIDEEATNIAISDSKQIFLSISNHIEVLNVEGKLSKKWDKFNDRSVITSIALADKSVFIADAGNKLVLEYDCDGNFVKEIGKKDTLNGIPGFFIPSPYFDVAMGLHGELWAVNSGLHAFEAYNSQGKLVSTWERTSMQLDGFSGCCNPSHIALLSDGSFVTSEKGLVRIKIHAPSGDFNCVVAGPNEFDEDTRGLDLAVNSEDDIFVIVPDKKEVRVYGKKSTK
jgi:hypothetical protein